MAKFDPVLHTEGNRAQSPRFNLLSGLGCFAAIHHAVCLLFGGKYKDRRRHRKAEEVRAWAWGGSLIACKQLIDTGLRSLPTAHLSCEGERARCPGIPSPHHSPTALHSLLSSVGQQSQYGHVMPAREGPVCFPREGSHPQFAHRTPLSMQEAGHGHVSPKPHR